MNKLIFCITSALIMALASCSGNAVYEESEVLPEDGWNKDSVKVFNVKIDDPNATYQVIINIRHTNNYKSQNLWLFTETSVDGKFAGKDTVECYLANNAGEWLGSGFGSLREMSILYRPKIKFPKAGNYEFKIKHGMRENKLEGLSDIGLEVLKIN